MSESETAVLALALLGVLAVLVTVASLLILSGGKFYQKIPQKARPRRRFVGIFFSYFVMFCLWFPVWFLDRGSLIARLWGVMFGAFTVFIAAWVALGRVGAILLPVIALIE
jgi:hypothetical protein